MVSQKFEDDKRIAHYLMLNSYFITDISLWYGQMGIALVMSEYSKYMGNKVYFDVASFLLNNMSEGINGDLALSFASGLTGIGWGIENLIQQGYIEGDSVEICEEIDQRIMEIDIKRISDLSLENGIEGLLHYVIYHLQGAIKQQTKFPFDKMYLSDLYELGMTLKQQNINKRLELLLDIYITFHTTQHIVNYNITGASHFVAVEMINLQNKISSYPIGLRNGLAGILFNAINARRQE
ncbi:hypothetical protein FACS1894179_06630 [Bacteroidia bacterium]|nr:hypothetical protein FACS1894169_10650 [Bacteroidia bacterium]GHV40311.1 hypothetical protein FACS1894179_06630 [Bacteroidia bacterium]